METIEVRGSGLGLNWTTGQPMDNMGNGVWSYTLSYKSNIGGFQCMNCSDPIRSTIEVNSVLKNFTFWYQCIYGPIFFLH